MSQSKYERTYNGRVRFEGIGDYAHLKPKKTDITSETKHTKKPMTNSIKVIAAIAILATIASSVHSQQQSRQKALEAQQQEQAEDCKPGTRCFTNKVLSNKYAIDQYLSEQ